MTDTITLPRSGVVLTKTTAGKYVFGKKGINWSIDPIDETQWVAWRGYIGSGRISFDEAVAWLDAEFLALRSALLEGAREAVARALHDVRKRNDREGTPISAEQYRDADAVLTALGAGGAKP